MQKAVTFETFSNAAPNSLYWYDLLPGDGVSVCEIPNDTDIECLREKLLSAEVMQLDDIDLVAALLLNKSSPLSSPDRWKTTAQRLSQTMAKNLTASGDRALRMRVQRLNYYIEALISSPPSAQDKQLVISEETLEGLKPWDYLEYLDAIWWISSGSPNIYRSKGSFKQHWSLGLPTQLDPLSHDRLSTGSIYSDGAYIFSNGDWSKLSHHAPVPLVFEHEAEQFFLDHFGNIYLTHPLQLIDRVPCAQVHFARHFNGVVYCLDNSDYGHITAFDMASRIAKKHSIHPVQVCNDIVATNSYHYLIDKQQGCIFKFDLKFRFLERRLQFGRQSAQLMDPVSIRTNGEHLQIVSWLSQKLTRILLF